MKRKLNILLLFLIICLSTNIAAQDVKHEFRLGFGDSFVDMYRAAQQNRQYNVCNNFITPNMFLDYMHHFNRWFSLGVQINTMWWGGDKSEWTQDAVTHSYLYGNTAIMPVCRFTYFRTEKEHLSLYSSLYAGYCAGLEKERGTYYYSHGIAAGLTALGVSFGGEHCFAAAELGALFSYGGNLQLGSRILSITVGYRY